MDKQNQFIFPNADIFISKIEHDFWMKASIKDFSNSALKTQPGFLNQIIPAIQNILKTIQPKLKFYDLNHPLYDYFSFQLAPKSHSGLTVTTISSENEKLIYIADLIHSDVILFHILNGAISVTPIWILQRHQKKLLQQLADTKIRAFAYHLPWPVLGYTKRKKQQHLNGSPESFMN